ncbi:MAG: OB-fold nucleic acid binding domain-containing protein, partial [archaeon]
MLKTHNTGEIRSADAGKTVTIAGWLDTFRLTGKISFILLRDRTGIIQVFVNKDLTAAHQHALKPESVVLITGKVNKRPANQVKTDMATGEVEIEATDIQILSQAETPLPMELTAETTTSIDKRLDYRFLDVRRENVKDIFLISAGRVLDDKL